MISGRGWLFGVVVVELLDELKDRVAWLVLVAGWLACCLLVLFLLVLWFRFVHVNWFN